MVEDLTSASIRDITNIVPEISFHPCRQGSLRGENNMCLALDLFKAVNEWDRDLTVIISLLFVFFNCCSIFLVKFNCCSMFPLSRCTSYFQDKAWLLYFTWSLLWKMFKRNTIYLFFLP